MSEAEQFPAGWSRATEIPHFKSVHHHGATEDGQSGVMLDWMPDYAAVFTRQALVPKWSQNFLLPTGSQALSPNDVILVPEGVEVTYDVKSYLPFKALAIKGTVVFDPDKFTRLMVGTIQVYPTGKLIIATNKGSANIVFTGPLDWKKDPEQFSLGLFTNGGTVTIEGRYVRPYTKAVSARAGQSIVLVDSTAGWRQGDTVLFADTQKGVDVSEWQYDQDVTALPQQFERRRVIGLDVGAVRLDFPLTYAHTGWVANETRSITLRTQEGNAQRAHVAFAGHARVRVSNACFYDLGRTTTAIPNSMYRTPEGDLTEDFHCEYAPPPAEGPRVVFPHNQLGRYPLHAHHVHEAVLFEGNVVTGSIGAGGTLIGAPRWGIVLHDSHGVVRNNVVIGARGAGIVGEGGSETGVVEDNLVIGTGGGEPSNSIHSGNYFEKVPALSHQGLAGPAAWGKTNSGLGYWFRGPFVALRRNKAAGHFKSGAFEIWTHGLTVTIPKVPRYTPDGNLALGIADDFLAGTTQQTNNYPLIFEDNESDAISPNQLRIDYAGGAYTIRRFRATHRGGGRCVDIGWSSHIIFEDLWIKGEGLGAGIWCNDDTVRFDLLHCHIEGFTQPYRADRVGEVVL